MCACACVVRVCDVCVLIRLGGEELWTHSHRNIVYRHILYILSRCVYYEIYIIYSYYIIYMKVIFSETIIKSIYYFYVQLKY